MYSSRNWQKTYYLHKIVRNRHIAINNSLKELDSLIRKTYPLFLHSIVGISTAAVDYIKQYQRNKERQLAHLEDKQRKINQQIITIKHMMQSINRDVRNAVQERRLESNATEKKWNS